MRLTREVNFRLPRDNVQVRKTIVQRIATTESRADGLEISSQAGIHQVHETVSVGFCGEAVIDAVEFGIILLEELWAG
jgi:hypothetical protein